MLPKKDNLYVTYITIDESTKDGVIIKTKYQETEVYIAYILWDANGQSCYIKTVKDNFQTYIVTYNAFANFIYLVDECFDLVTAANK